jgi:hypothetical protein
MIARLAAEGRSDRGFSPNRCREVFRRQPKSVPHESVGPRDSSVGRPNCGIGDRRSGFALGIGSLGKGAKAPPRR